MAQSRKRPFVDPSHYYVYVWKFRGIVIYVGQGKNNRGRPDCRAAWGGRCWRLCRLLEKYLDEIEVEYFGCSSQTESRVLEAKKIKQLKPKYNKAPNYGGWKGMHSEVGINSIKNANTGKKHTQEFRTAISTRMIGNQHLVGHKHTSETKAKISIKGKGRSPSALCRKKASERMKKMNQLQPPRKGKKCSLEHKRKLSLSKQKQGAKHAHHN